MDPKNLILKVRVNFTRLSLRRKIGFVVLLFLIGACISEPGFLQDADVVVEVGDDAEFDKMSELDSLIATFSEDKEPAQDSSQPDLDLMTDADSPDEEASGFLIFDDTSALTIPPEPEDSGVPVHTASHASETDAPMTLEIPSGRHATSKPSSGATIRLSGTIYPIH